MPELSILIPSRNEEFLLNTIEDLLAAIQADTEIIAVLDGSWAAPPIPDNPRVTLIYHSQSIGQRAATNEAARLSRAKYIMKCDAHCAFDKGFDLKLMADCEPDWTVIPRQYNLHVFDWECKTCKQRHYQGPQPTECEKCKGKEFERVIVWQRRRSRKSDFWRFDHEMHFQYHGDYEKRPEAQGDIADTMCCLGACWFMERKRYWEIGGCDEGHGSWGQHGVEMACKSWLSGGRQVVNKKTWFAHCFRTQPGFGFPYPNPGSKARDYSRDLWMNNKWPKQIHPLSWLLEKFAPLPGWNEKIGEGALAQIERAGKEFLVSHRARLVAEPGISSPFPEKATDRAPSMGIIYYTENQCPEPIASVVRRQLLRCANGNQIIAVSLKAIDHFGINIVLAGLTRGIMTMFKELLAGLEACTFDIVFVCEHDVLYHPSHFQFVPPRKDAFYYNLNVWKVDAETGHALHYRTKQTSGLCAYRDLLVEHYRKRIAKVKQNAEDLRAAGQPVKNEGYSRHMGFEPGCHTPPRGVDNYPALEWWSEFPNIDIRHSRNLTPNRWSQDQFRNKNSCQGWMEAEEVPGWGRTEGRFAEFLAGVAAR